MGNVESGAGRAVEDVEDDEEGLWRFCSLLFQDGVRAITTRDQGGHRLASDRNTFA